MNQFIQFAPVLILAAFLYFVLIRPQSKQQKKVNDMLEKMKIGDEVMTTSGFYGIISAIDDENVVLELLPDFNKVMLRKAAIGKVITANDAEDDEDEKDPEAAVAEAKGKALDEADAKVEEAEFSDVADDAKDDEAAEKSEDEEK